MTMAMVPEQVMYAEWQPEPRELAVLDGPDRLAMPPNLAALALAVEYDPAEAASLVAGIREESIIIAAFDRVRMHQPHPLVDQIAAGGLHAAYIRSGYMVAARQPSSIAGEVPATICEFPDPLLAEFGLDPSLTEKAQSDAMRLRQSSYIDEPTGAVPVKTTTPMPLTSEFGTDQDAAVSSARRVIGRLIDAMHTMRHTENESLDYYAKSLVEREHAMRMAEAAERGELPGHTPSEVRLLLAELTRMVADPSLTPEEAVEVIAVRTLVESGHIPRIVTLPALVRQRGAREAVGHVIGRLKRRVAGASRLVRSITDA